jgi:putative ABC transport system permease protein
MTFGDALRTAIRALGINRLRAGLTMMGIVIGIGAVIILIAVGNGAKQEITDQIQALGSNLLLVTPGSVNSAGVNLGQGSAVTLTYGDAKAIAEEAPAVSAVSPVLNARATVSYFEQNTVTTVAGVVPEFLPVRNYEIDLGRFIDQSDLDSVARVAVLGAGVERDLFGTQSGLSLGQSIKINRQSFEVIGVLQPKGGSGLFNQDDQIFVPLITAQTRLFGSVGGSVSQIVVQAPNQAAMDEASAETAAILRQRHGTSALRGDDFTIQRQDDILHTATLLTTTMTAFLGTIASVSLLVGGIGIMNVMLMSVTERTREIGLRKAVGARRRDILAQFVMEALLLCGLGGLGGIIAGFAISWLIGGVSISGLSLTPIVGADSVLLALGVSLAIGLFFGIYPARRASLLNPIDALRFE